MRLEGYVRVKDRSWVLTLWAAPQTRARRHCALLVYIYEGYLVLAAVHGWAAIACMSDDVLGCGVEHDSE